MNLDSGELSVAESTQVRILEWMSDQSETAAGQPMLLAPMIEEYGEHTVGTSIASLEDDGLVSTGPRTLAEALTPYDAFVTSRGAATVDEIRRARRNPRKRQPACRYALLGWIYDSEVAGDPSPLIDRFENTPTAHFLNDPFTQEEIRRASVGLKQQGLIEGTGAGPGFVFRPTITGHGRDIAEADFQHYRRIAGVAPTAPPSATAAPGGDTHINFHAPITGSAIAANSSNFTQSIAVGSELRHAMSTAADELRLLLTRDDLPEGTRSLITETAVELQELSVGDHPTDRGRLHRLRQKLSTVIGAGVTTAGTAVVADEVRTHLEHLLQFLPT